MGGTELPEPVDTPDGRTYVVRVYRAGTWGGRFPSARGGPPPSWLLIGPLLRLGALLHLLVYRGQWTVAVVPWHNLPGKRHRELAARRAPSEARGAALRTTLAAGEWSPRRPR